MLRLQEAQLNEVLSASNLDPSALTMVTRKLEVCVTATVHTNRCSNQIKQHTFLLKMKYAYYMQDVLDSKNSAIRDLQYELARVCKVKLLHPGERGGCHVKEDVSLVCKV